MIWAFHTAYILMEHYTIHFPLIKGIKSRICGGSNCIVLSHRYCFYRKLSSIPLHALMNRIYRDYNCSGVSCTFQYWMIKIVHVSGGFVTMHGEKKSVLSLLLFYLLERCTCNKANFRYRFQVACTSSLVPCGLRRTNDYLLNCSVADPLAV